jgi:uncharacterized membrane protein YvlD (DUF360 family)
MNTTIRLLHSATRLLVVWFADTLSLLVTALLVPGISFTRVGNFPSLVVATVAAFVLGIVNFLVRPLLLMIALPLGWAAVFVSGFFINAIILWITANLMTGFEVAGFWPAFWGGLMLSLVNTIITTILAIDDDDSFYENMVQRMAARQAGEAVAAQGRGLVILETDGLSYQRIQKAIADGVMPTLKAMMDEDGYQLSCWDAGLPPTTPACQAGILQGNNTNIPAFRWLDKKTGRMLAGGQAAAVVEPLISDGNGLLRGGTSIGNMFSGDAAKSILTFSKLFTGTPEDKKKRAEDMYLLMRNPYFFTRVLVLFFADVLLELWQGFQQRRKNVQPRLNRLHKGYPFVRAAVNVFLRDTGTYFTILDILRGAPAMYTLYAGYDEIAHHAGPYYPDTDLTLRQFDKQVQRLKHVIETKARRPYEILILSDHGQSFGFTFKQRYGVSILEFIQQQMPQNATLAGSGGGDDGTLGVSAMLDELNNMHATNQGGRVGKTMIHGAQRLIKNNLDQQVAFQDAKSANITLAYGGNGAQVYFDLFPRKVTLNELNAVYPGMVDRLVQHEGIGFVVAYDDDLKPVLFGKSGARNLHTGDIVGDDPLLPYGNVDLRAWQLARLADFENAGDLILNSTLYPDGTVAALEELIGNHGGLGGEQTDSYLFHPGDMQVPEIRGAFEIKAVLDSRRGLPGVAPKPVRPALKHVDAWEFSTMLQGISKVKDWLGLAARAITLDRAAYRQVAADAYMTSPALLLAVLAAILRTINLVDKFNPLDILIYLALWLMAVVGLYAAARLMRGKATFTATLRAAGFAQSIYVLDLLGFLPVIGNLVRFLAILVAFFGTWIGTATAHELRGIRTILLPFLYLIILTIGFVFLQSALEGTVFAFSNILAQLGWTPQP